MTASSREWLIKYISLTIIERKIGPIWQLIETIQPLTMVYDWDGRREVMMDLYIHQGKSLEEVMEWFKLNQNFTPR